MKLSSSPRPTSTENGLELDQAILSIFSIHLLEKNATLPDMNADDVADAANAAAVALETWSTTTA